VVGVLCRYSEADARPSKEYPHRNVGTDNPLLSNDFLSGRWVDLKTQSHLRWHAQTRIQIIGQDCSYEMVGVVFIHFSDLIAGTLGYTEVIANATRSESKNFDTLLTQIDQRERVDGIRMQPNDAIACISCAEPKLLSLYARSVTAVMRRANLR
jgi:hypothetical protein